MKSKLSVLLLIAMLALAQTVLGQQDAQFTQFMYNKLFYNPAYAGIESKTNFSLLYRQQWLGYNPTFGGGGAPETFIVSADVPVARLRSGVGFYAVADNLANANNLEFQTSFAYHLGFDKSKLSLGVRLGIISRGFDPNYRVNDQSDEIWQQLVSGQQDTQIRPDIGLGAHYQSEVLSIGVGVAHLVEQQFDFGIASLRNNLPTHLYGYASYVYEINYNVNLVPSVLFKTEFNTFNFDVGGVAEMFEKYRVGVTYRESDAIALLLGMNFLKEKTLRVGYAFDYVAFGTQAKEPTSHELYLSYVLPAPEGNGKVIQRTPRFRH